MPGKYGGYKKYNKTYKKYGKKPARKMSNKNLNAKVTSIVKKHIGKIVETKEAQWKTGTDIGMIHNKIVVLTDNTGNFLNPFYISQGTGDPMSQGQGQRIGDQITVSGVRIKGFLECALKRPKVFFRVMLVKCAKGDTPSDATFWKGDSGNKMIDVVNTERYTIIAQARFTVKVDNSAPAHAVNAAGEASADYTTWGGKGTKIFSLWIPGSKFSKSRNLTYENGSSSQLKFYDYRVVVSAYDWYGTLESSTVGKVNELYTKVYFKDA